MSRERAIRAFITADGSTYCAECRDGARPQAGPVEQDVAAGLENVTRDDACYRCGTPLIIQTPDVGDVVLYDVRWIKANASRAGRKVDRPLGFWADMLPGVVTRLCGDREGEITWSWGEVSRAIFDGRIMIVGQTIGCSAHESHKEWRMYQTDRAAYAATYCKATS